MISLREFRARATGLPDLLPWAALVDDGIILTKSGGFLACYTVEAPPDLKMLGDTEQVAWAARLSGAMAAVGGSGWAVWIESTRRPGAIAQPPGHWPDRLTWMLDVARHQVIAGRTWESVARIWLLWHPPLDTQARLARLAVETPGEDRRDAKHRAPWAALQTFRRALEDFEDRIAAACSVRRLRDETLPDGSVRSPVLAALQACIDPAWLDTPAMRCTLPMYLDAALGGRDLLTGLEPRVGDHYVIPIAVPLPPTSTHPGILEALAQLPLFYRWTIRFLGLDQQAALRHIGLIRSKWMQKRHSLLGMIRAYHGGSGGAVNSHAVSMAEDAEAAMSVAHSGAVRFGFATPVITVMAQDLREAREAAQYIRRECLAMGIDARIERVGAVEAWLASLPGVTYAGVRRPLIHTAHLAHLAPITGAWMGPERHPSPLYPAGSPPLLLARGVDGAPFRLCLHAGDVGHTAVIGPTGAGKSVLLATLAVAHLSRYPRSRVAWIDKGYSAQVLTEASAGRHYDLLGEHATTSLAPLARVDDPAEHAWALEWLCDAYALAAGQSATPAQRGEMAHALDLLAREPARHRTLSMWCAYTQDAPVREAMRMYCSGGPGGHLDGATDSVALDESVRLLTLEMEHLLSRGPQILLPTLSYIFHKLETDYITGRPVLLILDEAWIMLGHPVFRERIREWLKVLRKRNAAVVLATQSITDMTTSGIEDVIMESCPTRIYLPSPEALTPALHDIYLRWGLTERQIEIIARAIPKRHYYITQKGRARLIELALSVPELAVLAASDHEARQTWRQCQEVARGQESAEVLAAASYLVARGVPEEWVARLWLGPDGAQ